MEPLALHEVARDRQSGRGSLPLGLGGQARPRPAGVGVGLVVADVADRLGGRDGAQAGEGLHDPDTVALLPVERRVPTLSVYRVPAIRQPELWPLVAAVGH